MWDASDASDFKVEHEIYREDAVLDYPQSGERIRGRHNIQESRTVQPNKKRFTVRRIIGSGDLWITEFVLAYDGIPTYAVSIMEFREGLVANETQYFADRFDPGALACASCLSEPAKSRHVRPASSRPDLRRISIARRSPADRRRVRTRRRWPAPWRRRTAGTAS